MSERFIEPCAYCGIRPGTTVDHVVPRVVLGKHTTHPKHGRCKCLRHTLPAELLETVSACLQCNGNKLTRRLVPPSWADKLPVLNELLPGTEWRVWRGDVKEPAFSGVFA